MRWTNGILSPVIVWKVTMPKFFPQINLTHHRGQTVSVDVDTRWRWNCLQDPVGLSHHYLLVFGRLFPSQLCVINS